MEDKTTDAMKNARLSIISIVLSIVCLIVIMKINLDIAIRYLSSDGKTKALFGIIEITNFYYKYYFIILSLIAITIAIIASTRREKRSMNRIAYFIGILSLTLIFVQLWRIMI